MNFDKMFIASLLRDTEDGFIKNLNKIHVEYISKEYVFVYEYIIEHFETYKKIPDVSTVEAFSDLNFSDETKEPIEFYADRIVERKLLYATRDALKDFKNTFDDSHNAKDIVVKMEEFTSEMRLCSVSKENAISIYDNAEDVLTNYRNVKSGELIGVPSSWNVVDSQTLGWQPEDFVLFAARPGKGKTWSLLIQAHHAYSIGKKVLFITPEISQVRLLMRFVSLHLKLPYGDFRKGLLNSLQEKYLIETLTDLKESDDSGFMVMGKDMSSNLFDVRAAIYEIKPDIVFIDALYMMSPLSGKWADRYDRMSKIATDVKIIAKEVSLPFVTATQFNRTVEGNKITSAASLENLGLTDVLGWNIDWGFALMQDDDLRMDSRMIIRTMKTRESEHIKDLLINWQFTNMDFSEIGILEDAGKLSSLFITSSPDNNKLPSYEIGDIPF